MRQLWTGLLIFSMCVIIGCSSPVGSISSAGGTGRGRYDFLMLRPNRILYEIGIDGKFNRAEDLRVFVADNEGYRMLDIMDPSLKIEIILYPGTFGETPPLAINDFFPFSDPGRHLIRGTYGDRTDEYSIEARGTLVNPGDGSGFINIEWQ